MTRRKNRTGPAGSPSDFIVPEQIVLTEKGAKQVMDALEREPRTIPAIQRLYGKKRASSVRAADEHWADATPSERFLGGMKITSDALAQTPDHPGLREGPIGRRPRSPPHAKQAPISPIGRSHADVVREKCERDPEYRAAYEKYTRLGWCQEDVVYWASRSRPYVRRAILLLATVTETLSSVELNEHAGSNSGGAIVGGLLRWAKQRGHPVPIVKAGDGWRFRSLELAEMFEQVLARDGEARATEEQVRKGSEFMTRYEAALKKLADS